MSTAARQGDLENSRKREVGARDSLAAATTSSSSGESRAASRTPGGGRTEPETPWPQQLGAACQGRAGQPPELQEEGGQSQRLPGRSSSSSACQGSKAASRTLWGRGESQRLPDAAHYNTRLLPCKQGDVTKLRGAGQPQELPGRVRHQAPSLQRGGRDQLSGEQGSLRNSQGEGTTASSSHCNTSK